MKRLNFDPHTSVYLNCPYDAEFQPLFDASILAIVCCGFTPRSAIESGTVAEPRMDRITRAIQESGYSIHDLSRCQGEGDANFARFNMPLELGIAMAVRFLSGENQQQHDWLVIVPEGHQYGRYLSDLAGFDPFSHDGSEPGVIVAIMRWLATRPAAPSMPAPRQVLQRLPEFRSEMRQLRGEWRDQPPWHEILLSANRIARRISVGKKRTP